MKNSSFTQLSQSLYSYDLTSSNFLHQPSTDALDLVINYFTNYYYKVNIFTSFSKKLTLLEKLEINNFHPRDVDPRDFSKNRETSTELASILFLEDESIYGYFQKRGISYLFNPQVDLVIPLNKAGINIDSNLKRVIELYPELPYKISSPFDILGFSFKSKGNIVLILLLIGFIVSLFNLTQPLITSFLTNTAIPSSSKSVIYQIIFPAFVVMALTGLFQYFQGLLTVRIESDVDIRLQTAVWIRTFKFPISFISSFTAGDLNSRILSITTLRQLLGNQAVSTLVGFLFSFVYFVLMFISNWLYSLVALAVTFVFVLLLSYTVYKQAILQWPTLQLSADLTSFTFESIRGVSQIRSCQVEFFIWKKWLNEITNIALLQRSSSFWSNLASAISSLIQPIGTCALFAVIVYQLVISPTEGSSSASVLITFLPFYTAYSAFNQNMTGVFSTLINVAGSSIVNWKRAEPTIYEPMESGYSPNSVIAEITGSVEFNKIAFRYPDSGFNILQNVNFNVPAGSFTAITGPSGSGKTTLISLLLSFNNQSSGTILIDGISLNDYNIRDLRKQFGVVMQLAPLPSGTILKIVCAGRSYTEEEVWDSLEQAAVASQIRLMPLGLDTVLNENSDSISGGQKQRIAIARALISKPKILLLDEATSALDNESQDIVSTNLNTLSMTRIVIAHRLSTIKTADQIVYIDNHTVTAVGTFDDLREKGILRDSKQLL
jgi:ABC-type bacteriocin/lantibiotic exporter with double-glycine peptidase domain